MKVIVNSQAHSDHAGGFQALKRATSASLQIMEGDAEQVARGGTGDFAFGDKFGFPEVAPDKVLHDGEVISLGGTSMKAVLTPGHTRGCTTWTMTAVEGKQARRFVFVCSTTAPGYQLANNPKYPRIADDFRATFKTLQALPCDIFLGSHGSFFDLESKARRLRAGDRDAFVDPEGYRKFLSRTRDAFEKQLAAERHERRPP